MSIMTCRDVTITSQTRHFEFEAAILNLKPAVIQLTMTSPKVVKPEFNEYHLIRTPVFTSFKPPSAQSEVTRIGGGGTSADVSPKIFRIEVTSAIEYKYFPIEDISAQVYIPRW